MGTALTHLTHYRCADVQLGHIFLFGLSGKGGPANFYARAGMACHSVDKAIPFTNRWCPFGDEQFNATVEEM
jgi:hypothetical protein